jgi:hypothetical protein
MTPSCYVYDPTPEQPDEGFPVLCGGYPGATLYGPFGSVREAGEFANVSHPDDMNGNAVVLREAAL